MAETSSPLPRVTVIVPVFDVEDHVTACIASLRAQSHPDFEVVVIDDGSTDASGARARAAIGDDPRFRLVRQDNRGLSGARNTGLSQARGELIAFVDGDDRVAPDWIAQMVAALDETGADWVACAIAFAHDDPATPGHGSTHSAIHGAADLSAHVGPNRHALDDWRAVARHFPSAWNKLYRRSLIDGLTFPEGTWFEDHGFYWRVAARTDHILHLPQPLYVQTRGRAGQITAQDDDRVDQQFDVLDDIARVIAAGGKSHGAEALSRIASRLLFERTTALRAPARRQRFARDAALFLRDRGLRYSPDWDDAIARSFALEMEGALPLSVVLPWNGTGDLDATLQSLAAQHGPGREVLVICDTVATAARVPAPLHPEMRTLVCDTPGTGPARDMGIAQARGRFVYVLSAGDIVYPGALQQTVDLLLAEGADLALVPWRDAEGRIRGPFAGLDPGAGPLPPASLLALRPPLSSVVFARDFLRDRALSFGPGGAAALIVRAAAAGRIARLGWAGISHRPQPRPPQAARLAREHDALLAALPADLAQAFPEGWEKRLFARALRRTIDRAPSPQHRTRQARFLAEAALVALRRGLGGAGIAPAGHDPEIGPRLRRLMDPGALLRDGARAPGALLRGMRRRAPDASPAAQTAAPEPQPLLRVPFAPGGTLTLRARLDGADYANLGLLGPHPGEVPLHLSLQGAAGRVTLNSAQSDHWGQPLHVAMPLAGRADIAVDIAWSDGILTVAVDGHRVYSGPTDTPRARFPDLRRIAFADTRGGIDTASLRVTRALPVVASGTLILDDRLILRGRTETRGRLALDMADAPPLIADDDGPTRTVATPLPGRLWQARDALHLRVLAADGTEALPPLTLSRADILARVEAMLADPALPGDAEAAMLVAEHIRFARLGPDLTPAAGAALADLSKLYGLGEFLAPSGLVPHAPLTVSDGGTALLDLALARISQGLRADPPVDPDALLAQVPLPDGLLPTFLLTLSEVFTAPGRDPAPLLALAARTGPPLPDRLDDPWIAGAALPFLLHLGAWAELETALATVARPTTRWVTTAPLAWALHRALGTDLPDGLGDRIVETFRSFTATRAADYWDRTPCAALTGAAAALARARPDSADWAISTYGLAPGFWRALAPDIPPHLAEAHAAWRTVSDATAPPDAVETALARLGDTPDAGRIAREILGPAGRTDPAGAPPPARLRHLAFPGTDTVPDAGVAEAMPALYPDTPVAPDARDAPHDTLVVVVSCGPNLATRIPAMRAGWLGALAARGIPHVVVVGGGDGRREGDIVHLDAPDDYEGLPQKTLAAIAWVHANTAHTHMMKIDDDCFLNVDAVFDDPVHATVDYHGRKLTRVQGQLDRTWHMAKSTSARGRHELDRSPEPSVYADGGSGYALSRRAMAATLEAAATPRGRALVAASFMEDKMLGDLLRLGGIEASDAGWYTTIRRRTHPDAIPVPSWVNGFDASAVWPVKLTHLDTPAAQEKALSRLQGPLIGPAKIWPSYQEIRLGYGSNALELVSPLPRVADVRAAPVAVVACMRNEMFMLPRFLDHYRGLGVTAFAIADNLSDDGTLEYLEAQPDVAVFSVDTDYSRSRYGVAWQQALMSALRPGLWSLVADADELLVWQRRRCQTLPDLLDTPDFAGADAARIFMLDMYPRGALADADFTRDPFAQAGFADRRPFLDSCPTRGPFTDSPTWTSALRHRLIPGSRPQLFVAQKYALLRYAPFMRLSAGLHYVANTTLARRELLFAHFKYNADFRRKAQAEVARGQHFNDAEEYRKYLALASEGRDVVFEEGVSLPWTDSPFVRARLD